MTRSLPLSTDRVRHSLAPFLYRFYQISQAFQGRAEQALKGVAEEAAAVQEGVVEGVKTVYGEQAILWSTILPF